MTILAAAILALTTPGGPDYQQIAAEATALYGPIVGPDMVIIDGEPVPWALDLSVWLELADCEWKTGWHERTTGNGFYGRFQWALGTWRSLDTGYDYPDEAPLAGQIQAARENLDRSSWTQQWPGCSRKLGYR